MTEAVDLSRGTIRERLDRALVDYLATMTDHSLAELTIEAVAQEAGVSRATAYRYLGSREELLHRAALALAAGHIERCATILGRTTTVAARVEESFAYVARETSRDALLQLLLHSPRSSVIDTALREMSADMMGTAVREGQTDGQVRSDISADELISFLIEQLYVVERLGRDEPQTRLWVRQFVLPALRPPEGPDRGLKPQLRVALAEVQRKLAELDDLVGVTRDTLTE
jgi:AcrR family transcriptional regulator